MNILNTYIHYIHINKHTETHSKYNSTRLTCEKNEHKSDEIVVKKMNNHLNIILEKQKFSSNDFL